MGVFGMLKQPFNLSTLWSCIMSTLRGTVLPTSSLTPTSPKLDHKDGKLFNLFSEKIQALNIMRN